MPSLTNSPCEAVSRFPEPRSLPARWRRFPPAMVLLFALPLAACSVSRALAAPLPAPQWTVIRQALSELETGGNPKAVGAKGELTEFQVMPAIWTAECRSVRVPVASYRHRATAWMITHRLLKRRTDAFSKATKRAPSPPEIYALWNAPGTFARKGYRWHLLSPVVKERCRRFAALCEPRPATAGTTSGNEGWFFARSLSTGGK